MKLSDLYARIIERLPQIDDVLWNRAVMQLSKSNLSDALRCYGVSKEVWANFPLITPTLLFRDSRFLEVLKKTKNLVNVENEFFLEPDLKKLRQKLSLVPQSKRVLLKDLPIGISPELSLLDSPRQVASGVVWHSALPENIRKLEKLFQKQFNELNANAASVRQRLALAYSAYFCVIENHLYVDGNGRYSRILFNLALSTGGEKVTPYSIFFLLQTMNLIHSKHFLLIRNRNFNLIGDFISQCISNFYESSDLIEAIEFKPDRNFDATQKVSFYEDALIHAIIKQRKF